MPTIVTRLFPPHGMEGVVSEIYIAPIAGAPARLVSSVNAFAGIGLEGDRYARGEGTYSNFPGPHDVTLFEIESIWKFLGKTGVELHPSQVRRNIITEGITLKNLIDKEFLIGDTRMKGNRMCPPCLYLAQLLKIPEVLPGLADSGGIYAEILDGGKIATGDKITTLSTED